MSKYIIKNCPCFNEGHPMLDYYGECLSLTDDTQVCQDCTDCVMKQIVELCKQTCRKRCTNDCLGTKKHCGYKQILKLLDIQEDNQ
jgi:hypothetical protein